MPVDYSKGKIYKIITNINDDIYIGSTCEPNLGRRLSQHKTDYKYYLNGKKGIYATSFKILETGNYDIVLIENYPCETKDQLHARERYWIENMECVNKNIPGRTVKEYCQNYYQKNKDYMNEQKRKWVSENRDKVNAYCREYYKKNKNT
jgi:hypothetical protein